MRASDYIAALPEISFPVKGRLVRSVGLLLEATGPRLPVGALATVQDGSTKIICEVVGFSSNRLLLLALNRVVKLSPGSSVAPLRLTFHVGDWIIGRILDGLGQPIDGKGKSNNSEGEEIDLDPPVLNPMERACVSRPFDVGVRAINGLLTMGEGQKIGVFSMPGVGKSALLGMMARGAEADVNVIALIGERGREAREFVEDILGEEGLKRSVVIVVTGDMPAPMWIKGATLATAIAAYFREKGKRVLLLMDSLTRVAMAQREVGLASGEPPTARGYPPSVFALIPRLVEQAGGKINSGSITAIYTVLVQEDNDPIGELAKSTLDGHIVLSRELAERAIYPAIDPLASVSRVAHRVCSPEHNRSRLRFLELFAHWREASELISIGSYNPGSDRKMDEAVTLHEKLEKYLKQDIAEKVAFDQSVVELEEAIR